uniref:NADH dehydrogenase [ubiquinone] 1 beta subcomplex subunit 9 n=1 Tax=Octactis speculum TaxID=3111310 RepID=A0A7S2DAM5_9STRA|eukprot:CAMPEP_0185768280 /NCGR_PEP_ID=MMETSP1174-20130828/48736_1 /TAXON_ID=35687 /ORGANISM="Dictyocha speculum, Strain CCMP1381" /LENGTH=160 /DNA_ID=CAMNT_0028452897 /DNA_START=35 /DNA_END=517 /DNA_ORIENTATION=+
MANAAFVLAAKQYRQKAPDLTHAQVVCRLYRASLKTLGSWAVDRQVFLTEALKIQAEFRANENLSADSPTTTRLVKEGQEKLFSYTHPDKYIPAYLPGGSLYMRNPPLPLSVCYPDGIPEGVEEGLINKLLNIDMSPVRSGESGATVGQVIVDASSKSTY